MTCRDFEQRIALYVEGDLSGVERGRVEAHLRECSNCWDLAEDLKESQAVFKSMRENVPDATALSVLRERVLSEVSGLEPLTWLDRLLFGGLRRKAALTGIAVIVIGAGTMWLTRTPSVLDPASRARVASNGKPVGVAADIPVPLAAVPQLPGVSRQAPKPAPETHTQEPKQATIKLFTDDPNVIIYWIVDEKGD